MSHWHITKNTPGYSPWDWWTVATKRDAIASLKDEKRFWLDQDYEGQYRFSGDARRDLGYFVEDTSKTYDLGSVIAATECHEPECEEEGNL